jgi:galactokinase
MDQFCASLGRHGSALLLDCRDNTYRSVKIPQGYKFVAVHSGIKRKLESKMTFRVTPFTIFYLLAETPILVNFAGRT